MTYAEIVTAADNFGINIQTAVNMRVKYLEDMIETHEANIALMETREGNAVTLAFIDMLTENIGKEIRSARYQLKALQRRGVPDAGEITPDMIKQAKAYPIDKLINFDRAGKAIAFCHPDKQPSLMMSRKSNSCRCFPCNKTFDPIDILRERDGLKFHDAVRSLI